MWHVDQTRRERIVTFYTKQHLTIRAIAKIEGISGAGVWKNLKAAGVQRTSGTRVQTVCSVCSKPISVGRARWRDAGNVHCSPACYDKRRANPSYVQHRHGQRLARKAVIA